MIRKGKAQINRDLDRLQSWRDNYEKSTDNLNGEKTLVKEVCHLESNCTLNEENKDIESGIEVSGYGELSELADHVITTSMNRNGHENVNKEEVANVKVNENSEKPSEHVNIAKPNLENVCSTETVYSPGTDTGDQYTLNSDDYFSKVNVDFRQSVRYVTFRGLTHSGNIVICKPDLDENDLYIFNQKGIACNRHFDLIQHFPGMRSSLLYVKEIQEMCYLYMSHLSEFG